ncbi:MAG TPA: zinc ribbon domain-containing protein [Thermoanaerobaculia bacterium]|nr:zinc ribbon domain-containing protein [Thermoanaerobaculia bacterium]
MSRSEKTELFENAIDSLEHGVQHFLVRKEAPTAIKHSILTIYHSIELFLKERLARIHPNLIYRNIDKRITDDSQTVGLAETIQRLENLGINLSGAQVKDLLELQRRRNRIEHHRFDPTKEHELVVGQALKFLLDFLPEHLGITLEEVIQDQDAYRAIIDAIFSYQERIKQAHAEVAKLLHSDPRVGDSMVVSACPECGERTLVVASPRGDFCFFCHTELSVEKCEACYQYFNADDLDALGMCPRCAEEAYRRF